MGKNNIEKYSFGYSISKFIVNFLHNYIFYRKVIVIGRENIDRSYPNIFAPNHQNALMDALAVLCTTKGQPVFLARSDIFRKRFVASILYFMKILPVYRIRDGFDSLRHNDEIFEKTVDVLRNRNGLVILPEGSHSPYRRLRQLKKGICRIAFQTEEANDYKLNIKIIPVGLEFSNYWKFREILTVVYGRPIDMSDLYELYRESPQIAYNRLRDRISRKIKSLMIHIESEDDYEALNELREIVNGRYAGDKKDPKIFRDKLLIGKLELLAEKDPSMYRDICNRSLKIKNISASLNIGYFHLSGRKPRTIVHFLALLGLTALLPLFIFGFVTNYLFYKIPKIPLRNLKDRQFQSSFRYVLSLALGLILFPAYALLAFLIIRPWWLALILFAIVIPSGLFAWNYALIWQKLLEGIRVRKYYNRNKGEFRILRNIYRDLMSDINKL